MLDDRFWTKVSRPQDTDCWIWTGGKNNKGYGQFRPGGMSEKRLSHRLAYEDRNGPIPAGMVIMHACDNPACVNPDHLSAGTEKQNMTDAAMKGRNGSRKLTEAIVIALLRDYVGGMPRRELVRKYRIPYSSISDYTSGRNWQWLHGKHGCPTSDAIRDAADHRPGAKITKETAIEIRKRLADGALGIELAAEYGLHKATISDIKLRKIWGDA